jgi:hypothetical protein
MADTAVVLGKHHWMLYWLVTAMYPQFLITMNEEIEEQAVTVRVGQAVNTIGQAGTRHGISGVSLASCGLRPLPAGRDIDNDTDIITAADIINSNTDNTVPNTPNAGSHRYQGTRRNGHERVFPVSDRVGELCHPQKVRLYLSLPTSLGYLAILTLASYTLSGGRLLI